MKIYEIIQRVTNSARFVRQKTGAPGSIKTNPTDHQERQLLMKVPTNTLLKGVFLLLFASTLISCGSTLAQKREEAEIHFRLGSVHLNERNYTDALKELTAAVEMHPGEPSYHNALGLAYFARNMNSEAIKEMKKAIELNPKFSEAHVALSAVYIVDGRWDAAIQSARAALDNIFYGTPQFAHYNMGQAFFNKGDYKAALESYRKAADEDPRYALAYYSMGLTLDKMNNYRDSAEAYERAVKAAPAFANAWFNLGVALLKQNDKAGAQKAFEKAIEVAPDGERAQAARDYIRLLK